MSSANGTPPLSRTRPSVLLFGCGKIGTRLGESLLASGHRVIAVRRNTEALPRRFHSIALDYRQPLTTELPAADSVVITLKPGAAQREPDDLVGPLRRLAAALPARPRRVLLVSSTRVFDGYADGRAVTEGDDPQPASARARALLDSELAARDLFDATVVRPGGIYGPGREHLIRQVARGTAIDAERRTNRIHETDLVRALHALLCAPTLPPTIHAVDDHPATLGEIARHIASRLGVPAPPMLPGTPSGRAVSGSRLVALLGELRYRDYRAGYDEMINAGDFGSLLAHRDSFGR